VCFVGDGLIFCLIFVIHNSRGCQSCPKNYLTSNFLLCKIRPILQLKSDWSKHKKPAIITVTSRICFFGCPRSKLVFHTKRTPHMDPSCRLSARVLWPYIKQSHSATRPMVSSKRFTLMQMLKRLLDALLLQKKQANMEDPCTWMTTMMKASAALT